MTIDLVIRSELPKFSEEKHFLGRLCKREHDGGGGKSWRNIGHGNCVQCTRDRASSWNRENPERAAESTRRRDARRVSDGGKRGVRYIYPFATFAGSARARARKSGLPECLSPDDLRRIWLRQEGRCFWTGVQLDFSVGGHRHPFRPSMDRIVPAMGYVAKNIVWASNFANRARNDLPANQFAELIPTLGLPDVSAKLALLIAAM